MSSDYRPRGGSSSSSSPGGSGGGRRRRGGRNRGGRGRSGEHRSHSSHTNGTSSAPAKKEHPIAKLFGWLTGKNKKKTTTEHKAHSLPSEAPRHESRPPRADRADRPPRAERPPREERPAQEEDLTPQEIVTTKLYVGNLSYDAGESELFDLFSKIGLVKNVEIALDRRTNRSKGFGFVEMDSLDVAKEASAKLNRTDFMGRQIVVSGAKMERRSVNNRDGESEGGRPEEESTI
jgi:hypothetical protein